MSRALAETMRAEADACSPNETGGVLLGVADDSAVWIEVVIGPGPGALHTRSRFVPDAAYQQEQIATAYKQSGRKLAYLGDWHTHPNMPPYLSAIDYSTLRATAAHKSARQPRPVMAVLGRGDPWQLSVWRFRGGRWLAGRRLEPLIIVFA